MEKEFKLWMFLSLVFLLLSMLVGIGFFLIVAISLSFYAIIIVPFKYMDEEESDDE